MERTNEDVRKNTNTSEKNRKNCKKKKTDIRKNT